MPSIAIQTRSFRSESVQIDISMDCCCKGAVGGSQFSSIISTRVAKPRQLMNICSYTDDSFVSKKQDHKHMLY